MINKKKIENVIIIGSGPSAYTAGIYTGRALLEPLLFEGENYNNMTPGGQLTTTTEVENYPGFVDGVDGWELMEIFKNQAVKWGTKIKDEIVTKIDTSSYPYKVYGRKGSEYLTKSIIVSTGATAKRLNLPNEEVFWSKGISACATCDGALPLFRKKPLIVIGGGDSACEEATFLSKYGSKIYMLVRKDSMRASKIMQQKVNNNSKIEILYNTEIIDVLTDSKKLERVKVINNKNKKESIIEANGLFYAIGHTPNTSFLDNQLKLDENGYIITKPDSTRTSVSGIFASGDVQDHYYRQAITAAGTGCMAAIEVEKYLESIVEA